MKRTYEAPSNETPHTILGYLQGHLMTYLLCDDFSFTTGPCSNYHKLASSHAFATFELYEFQVLEALEVLRRHTALLNTCSTQAIFSLRLLQGLATISFRTYYLECVCVLTPVSKGTNHLFLVYSISLSCTLYSSSRGVVHD